MNDQLPTSKPQATPLLQLFACSPVLPTAFFAARSLVMSPVRGQARTAVPGYCVSRYPKPECSRQQHPVSAPSPLGIRRARTFEPVVAANHGDLRRFEDINDHAYLQDVLGGRPQPLVNLVSRWHRVPRRIDWSWHCLRLAARGRLSTAFEPP